LASARRLKLALKLETVPPVSSFRKTSLTPKHQLPESVISPLPEIVSTFAGPLSAREISIKKDRFSPLSGEIPIGTPVVLEHTDTSRSARLTVTKAGGARN
jgi:hypothetical protein